MQRTAADPECAPQTRRDRVRFASGEPNVVSIDVRVCVIAVVVFENVVVLRRECDENAAKRVRIARHRHAVPVNEERSLDRDRTLEETSDQRALGPGLRHECGGELTVMGIFIS